MNLLGDLRSSYIVWSTAFERGLKDPDFHCQLTQGCPEFLEMPLNQDNIQTEGNFGGWSKFTL